MNKSELMEMALEKLMGDMDDLEGDASMAHSQEECPDPLGCKMHDADNGDSLSDDKLGGVEGAIKKEGPGLPSMKSPADEGGEGEGPAEDGLSSEEAEELRKLLAK